MLDREELIAFEREVADLWEAGKLSCPIHLSGGNEEQLLEIFKEIKPHDYVFSGHRNHYHALLHGIKPNSLMAELLAQEGSRCKGRARSMGFIDLPHNFYASAIVGGMCAVAVGTAWTLKAAGKKEHVWCFIGDGALDGGHFWEALNYAIDQDLPITFVVEDNNRATCSSKFARGAEHHANLAEALALSDDYKRVRYYQYNPVWPHVGTGKYVAF